MYLPKLNSSLNFFRKAMNIEKIQITFCFLAQFIVVFLLLGFFLLGFVLEEVHHLVEDFLHALAGSVAELAAALCQFCLLLVESVGVVNPFLSHIDGAFLARGLVFIVYLLVVEVADLVDFHRHLVALHLCCHGVAETCGIQVCKSSLEYHPFLHAGHHCAVFLAVVHETCPGAFDTASHECRLDVSQHERAYLCLFHTLDGERLGEGHDAVFLHYGSGQILGVVNLVSLVLCSETHQGAHCTQQYNCKSFHILYVFHFIHILLLRWDP